MGGPLEFMVVGELDIGADEGVFGAEADAVAELQSLVNARGVLSRVMWQEGKDSAVAAVCFAELLVDG